MAANFKFVKNYPSFVFLDVYSFNIKLYNFKDFGFIQQSKMVSFILDTYVVQKNLIYSCNYF